MCEDVNQSPTEAGSSLPSLPRANMPDLPLTDSSAAEPADMTTDHQLSLVRSRLIADLGAALASWFQIVPSDHASGELGTVALLLEAHLPVRVPATDVEEGPIFFVSQYDIDAHRRKTASQREPRAAHSSLSDALLAANAGFQELKSQADLERPERYPRMSITPGDLPEERWLRHQLAHRMPPTQAHA